MVGKTTPKRPADQEDGPTRPERMMPCDWCARLQAAADLVWVGSETAWLCPGCRAEAESCGCSD